MLSVLKLVRVMRLSRMISRLNAKDHIKISLRLGLMVFYTILYLHSVACFWYFYSAFDKEWIPISMYSWKEQDIYTGQQTFRNYLQVLYAACLTTTGNDIVPLSTEEVILATSLLIMGMLVNAIIFGNMVISI